MRVEYVHSDANWEYLIIDGRICEQGHHVDTQTALKAVAKIHHKVWMDASVDDHISIEFVDTYIEKDDAEGQKMKAYVEKTITGKDW